MTRSARRSLALVALAGVVVALGLAFPSLRGLTWIHFRTALPDTYVLPLPGLLVSELDPSFGAFRTLGPHEGIDIVAPAGTPVLAAADGIVVDDRATPVGGNVLWIQGAARQLYYYAHMQSLEPGLRAGTAVSAGNPIGTVGNTGNAIDTPPHLHFAIYHVTSNLLPLRYHAIDPYPVLVASGRTAPEPTLGRAPARRPPRELAAPIDPEGSRSLAPSEIAARAEAAADHLASVLRPIDPFLGVESDGDVRRVPRVYGLPDRVRRLASELRTRGADADRQGAADARGGQLYELAERIERLLAWSETCAPRERSAFLNALETLALSAARDPAPAEPSGARADYFFFAGHPPDLVPVLGGWLGIVGRGLGASPAPGILLTGPDGEPITRLESHGLDASGRSLAVHVPPRFLASWGGSCLTLHVEAVSERDVPARRVPLCIPASYTSGYRITSYLSYQLPTARRTLETDEILFANTSCSERKQVSQALTWPLAPGGRLVDLGEFEVYAANESSIACALESNRVTCSGWLAPARCEGEARGDSEWHHIFSPTEEYPSPEVHRSGVLSPLAPADAPSTQTCVELHRAERSEETSMWFHLFVQNADQQENLFSSPREVVTRRTTTHYEVGPHRIEAELDPDTESGLASVCVTIHSPACRSPGAR